MLDSGSSFTRSGDQQQTDLRRLIDEAEQLQLALSLFCSRATVARVELPQSLHDAAAALLLLPEQLRQTAERSNHRQASRAVEEDQCRS
jgi:hypothetical protein